MIKEYLGIAETIFKQLGGNKFRAMTGAHTFLADKDNSLNFHVPVKAKKLYIKIRLTPADLYDMTFTYYRGTKILSTETIDGLYNDQLCSVFEKKTGLYTSL